MKSENVQPAIVAIVEIIRCITTHLTKKSTKDIILIIDVKISSTSKAFHVLLLIIGSVDTERKQKEPYITTTFIKKDIRL